MPRPDHEGKPVMGGGRERVREGNRLCHMCERSGSGCAYGVDRLCLDDAERAMQVELACSADHEGGPGVAHGGWVAAVLDELLGQLAVEYSDRVVTANLSIDYRRPVPIDQPLIGRARWVSQEGRKIRTAGSICLAANDAVLAEASGLFILIDPDHHRRHADWVAAQKEDPQ
jgi:uncharacterized protein (TIGR00369 family)